MDKGSALRLPPRSWLTLAAVAVVGGLAYLPNVGIQELRYEEPRRAMPARAMLETGDFVTPRLMGEPYLTKPPLYFWAVAGVGSVRGSVDEIATRLPSTLAVVFTGLLVAWFAMSLGGPAAGAIGGVGFLLGPTVLRTGSLGETDGLFGAFVFLTIVALWQARRAGRWHLVTIVLGGLALGAAILTKGPQALVFVSAAVIGLVVSGEVRLRELVPAAGIVVIGAGLAALWGVALLQVTDPAEISAVWSRELGRGGFHLESYLSDRGRFLVTTPLGLLPVVVALGVAWRERLLRGWRENPPIAFLVVTVALAFLFFAFYPGSRPRYFYPAAPVLAVLSGLAVSVGLDAVRRSVALRTIGILVAIASACLTAVVLVPALRRVGDLPTLGRPGLIGLVALLLVAGFLFRQCRQGAVRLWLLAAPLLLLRLIAQVDVVPDRADRRGYRAAGAAIERLVRPDSAASVGFRGDYPVLYYTNLTLQHVGSASEVPSGSLLLKVHQDSAAPDPPEFSQLGEVPVTGGYRIRVLERPPR